MINTGKFFGTTPAVQLQLVRSELKVANTFAQLLGSFYTGFENYSVLKPNPMLEIELLIKLGRLGTLGAAMKILLERASV